jgi:hypothetical protein
MNIEPCDIILIGGQESVLYFLSAICSLNSGRSRQKPLRDLSSYGEKKSRNAAICFLLTDNSIAALISDVGGEILSRESPAANRGVWL